MTTLPGLHLVRPDRKQGQLAGRGALVGVCGHPVLLEVFDHPATLVAQWDAILASVAMDALLAPRAATPGHRARAFVHRVLVSTRGITTGGRVIHAAAINIRHQLVLAA